MARVMKDSGIEWIGEIPQEWEVRKLYGLLKTIGSGTTPKGSDSYYDGDILWLNTGDLNDGYIYKVHKSVTQLAVEECSALKIFPEDSVVIAMYGATIGKLGITTQPLTTNQACCVMSCDKNLKCKYLFYWFLGNKEFIITLSYGAGQPNISQEVIKQLQVTLPLLFEQKSIADFLSRKCSLIDSSIEKQKVVIEKLKLYKQSLITEVVTKGLDPTVKMKPSGIEWIGDIPEGWDVKPLFFAFKERKCKNTGNSETNLLSLSYGNIVNKDASDNMGLLPESFEGYNIIEKGNIVFRLTDLQNDHVSLRSALVLERGIITSAYVTIESIITLSARFFNYLFRSYDYSKAFYNMGGGVRQGINYNELKKMPLIILSSDEQQAIANYLDTKCSSIDNIINTKQKLIEQLSNYKKSLIYECVTGKREVV